MLMTRFIVCERSTVGWTQKVVCAPRSTEIDPPLAMRTCCTNEGVVNAPGNYSPRSADIPSVFIFDLHHPYQHPTNATHGCDDRQILQDLQNIRLEALQPSPAPEKVRPLAGGSFDPSKGVWSGHLLVIMRCHVVHFDSKVFFVRARGSNSFAAFHSAA